MKRILGIAMVLGLVGALTVMAQEVKPGKAEVIDLGKDVKLEMVLVPAGKFKMGSPASEKGRKDNETQHEVTLTKPFYMGKYEVTQEQWEGIMGNNPSETKGAKLPVTNVSWNDCQEFIKKLNASTKGGYRLPTEAEWEYACRAGATTAYSFGDSLTKSDANIVGFSIKPVGSYKPNAFGLYDTHGNVDEWCEDWYEKYPAGAVTDPKGPQLQTVGSRVTRGGSCWEDGDGSEARSSYRSSNDPRARSIAGTGFRLARTADSKGSVASPTETKPDPTAVLPAMSNLLVVPFTEAKAKEVQKEVAKSLQKEVEEKADLGEGVKLEMVLVPAGKFKMGSPASEEGHNFFEAQHEVTLTKPYYMGKYEVTQEQWEAVMGKNPSIRKGAKLPVTDVSWEDCQEFIKKLNAKTKGGYRLPTEAEWEYACRAGTTTAHSFGDKITPKDANYGDSNIDKPVAVGSYKPNAFGFYDMHGNVWEWCEDWYDDYPAGAVTDPKGPATGGPGGGRVLRGGSHNGFNSDARSSVRLKFFSTNRDNLRGFRLARTADIKAGAAPTGTKPDPKAVIPATGNLLVAPFTEAKAKEVQKEVAKSLKKEVEEKEDLGKDVKLEMVLLPAGKFEMGFKELEDFKVVLQESVKKITKKEIGKEGINFVDLMMSGQGKQHEVTLTKPSYMGKYEVTQEQWEAVMGENPSRTKGAKLPVTDVSWEDCQEFIKKLNAKTNGGYRLPTEAEWEYACRAGTTTAYSFGDKITLKDANINGDGTAGSIKSVGSYKPNAFGLYDMHGNVDEWCEDWHGEYPFAVTDPRGPATGENRVLRGGCFAGYDPYARSSFRGSRTLPTDRGSHLGFRLARTP